MRYKAYNTRTGKFFVEGRGFVAACLHVGTTLNEVDKFKSLQKQFKDVGVFPSKNSGESPEWLDCDCDSCVRESLAAVDKQ